MEVWRKHWFDVGGVLALALGAWLYGHRSDLPPLPLILGLNLVALLLHQLEEYRWPGYFPGMLNTLLFRSNQPDRYPLNPQTSLIINVLVGWGSYALAAAFSHLLWLGIATMLVSVGNLVAHTVLFNLKGRTWYNPGLATCLLLFLPLIIWFGHTILSQHRGTTLDWLLGGTLGVALNYLGILKLIDWLADRNTPFRFSVRQLPPTGQSRL